jgi:hypothetical protein
MSEKNFEIDKETLYKVFIQIEEFMTNQTDSSNFTINDNNKGEKIKLKKITFNNKNPYLEKVKKIKNIISNKK